MIHGVSAKEFLRELRREMGDDNVYNGAAALGFYLTLAIFPAMILIMSALPYLPIERVDEAIMDLLGQALPEEAYGMVQEVMDEVMSRRRGGLLSLSLLATAWVASTGVYAIMQQLNITYGVKEARGFLRGRFTAFVLSFLFGALVIGAFSLIVLGGAIEDWIAGRLDLAGALPAFFSAFRWVVIVLALLLGFATIYYFGPNVEQKFRFITPGSVFAAAMLILASLGFSLYTRNFANYDATYGSIGAVIILMLWLYMVGLVILVGSEINVFLEHHARSGKRKGEKSAGEAGREPERAPPRQAGRR